MKKSIYSIAILFSVAFVLSCTDDSLDPLQQKNVKKGTLLALRGTQLNNLYVKGIAGAEVFPKIMTGTEKFAFDGEFLSADPNSLASVDVYVIKKGTGGGRILMSNVPFSQFKNDGTYKNPWVSISYDMNSVLAKLGLPPAGDPIYLGNTGNPLLTAYQPGINFEADLNLVDGSKIPASDIVAAGLFQSNQFYPAMLLTWTMTDYCAYVANSWSGKWLGDEVGVGVGGTDDLGNFAAVAADTWKMDNFFGYSPTAAGLGPFAVIKFSASTNPGNQVVTYVNDTGLKYQTVNDCFWAAGACTNMQLSGSGTYSQCTQTMSINTVYTDKTTTFKWVYNLHR